MHLTLQMLLEENHTTFLPDDEKAFLIRVQLSNSKGYDGLHEVMELEGFERKVKDMAGRVRDLPHSTYFIAGQPENSTPKSIHSRVKKAVIKHKVQSDQPDVTAQIIVVSVGDAWFELEETQEAQEV